jgi:hypothetical protein
MHLDINKSVRDTLRLYRRNHVHNTVKPVYNSLGYNELAQSNHLTLTVANFSPEHSGTEKGQRGYPLCLKSEIFIFIMKSFDT